MNSNNLPNNNSNDSSNKVNTPNEDTHLDKPITPYTTQPHHFITVPNPSLEMDRPDPAVKKQMEEKFVGKKFHEVEAQGGDGSFVKRDLPEVSRIIKPGSMVTRDFNPERYVLLECGWTLMDHKESLLGSASGLGRG